MVYQTRRSLKHEDLFRRYFNGGNMSDIISKHTGLEKDYPDQKLIDAYIEKFGQENCPFFGYEPDELENLIKEALRTGNPIPDPSKHIPDDAVI